MYSLISKCNRSTICHSTWDENFVEERAWPSLLSATWHWTLLLWVATYNYQTKAPVKLNKTNSLDHQTILHFWALCNTHCSWPHLWIAITSVASFVEFPCTHLLMIFMMHQSPHRVSECISWAFSSIPALHSLRLLCSKRIWCVTMVTR